MAGRGPSWLYWKRQLWPLVAQVEGVDWPAWLFPPAGLLDRLPAALSGGLCPLSREEPLEPFFVVGPGRSGSTLLRRILQAGPGVHIPPENHGLRFASRAFRRRRHLCWPELVGLVLEVHRSTPGFEHLGLELEPVRLELEAVDPEERSLARIVDAVYRHHAAGAGVALGRWGDKTPLNCFAMGAIRLVFPRGALRRRGSRRARRRRLVPRRRALPVSRAGSPALAVSYTHLTLPTN